MNHPIINFISNNTGSVEQKLQKFQSEHRIVYKRHGNLIITKYTKEGKYGNQDERLCRGSIIDLDKLVLITPSIPGDISYEDFKSQVPFKYCVVEDNIEGTLINVYFYNGRWNVSTKYNINADESKFRGKKTFRQLFDSLFDWDNLEKKLDTSLCYSFVLSAKDNKMVSPVKNDTLHHIETTNRITGDKIFVDIGIPHPKIHYLGNLKQGINVPNPNKMNQYEDLEKSLKELDYTKRGYMLYSLDRKFRCSLVNPKYQRVFNMIKDQSDTDFLCFKSLYYDKNSSEITKYCPDLNVKMQDVSIRFETFFNIVYKMYVDKYCYKLDVDLNNKYGKMIKLLNRKYNEDRQKITRQIAREVILSQDCPYVYVVALK